MITFGMIPELIGRLPVVTTMKNLTSSEMLKILIEPKNALIKQYEKLFQIEGVELVFEKDALLQIVEIAKKRNSGARAWLAVMEECLMGLMYKVPDNPQIDKITITGEFILGNTAPVMTKNINKKSA